MRTGIERDIDKNIDGRLREKETLERDRNEREKQRSSVKYDFGCLDQLTKFCFFPFIKWTFSIPITVIWNIRYVTIENTLFFLGSSLPALIFRAQSLDVFKINLIEY